MSIHDIIIIAIGVIAGFLLAVVIYLIKRNSTFRIISQAKQIVEELKSNARNEIETSKKAAVLEAKDEWFKQKRVMEDEIKERQKELRVQEKKYNDRLGSLDKRCLISDSPLHFTQATRFSFPEIRRNARIRFRAFFAKLA